VVHEQRLAVRAELHEDGLELLRLGLRESKWSTTLRPPCCAFWLSADRSAAARAFLGMSYE